jgi:hypothetical protein
MRNPALARKFEPSAAANWIVQADRDDGKREDGLTTEEREELRAPAPRQSGPPGRARDPPKSRGLVRQGDHVDPVEGNSTAAREHQASGWSRPAATLISTAVPRKHRAASLLCSRWHRESS